MRHATTTLLAAACLALAGCSDGGEEPTKTVTATVTTSPSLSEAEAKQACVKAWLALMTADGYDPDAEPATPDECGNLPGQADMYAEALAQRNAANRESLDECLENPACTGWPVP
ncbi:hypothetical protein [Streptomyces sp. MB09-02B]|uniref:hypothetical protein n=1 Tax=Streptomyces sp. MB09-02B TaxID=3028667 RepID=UPI0029B5D6FB|nr:hypothetical protein [Streptomyces sp. MB09-02B]MDX3645322.1 hypothetical protein [Streptomyces sp. MB09-02B]